MSYLETLEGLIALWAGVVILGAAVSYYAIHAWRSSRERSFGLLAGGFVAISIASGLTWVGLYFMGQPPLICEAGSTSFTFGGFASILYSLRTRAP